jgi:GNAT superfamily N-acetyltransferase
VSASKRAVADSVRIEPLATEHAADAAALAQAEGLISVEVAWLEAYVQGECASAPELALGAWEGQRLVGVSIGADFGSYAFLGPLAVASDRQGSGIGGALLERSLRAVQRLPSVALEATNAGRQLYDRRGFVPEWTTIRLRAESPRPVSNDTDVDEGDFERLVALDRASTGGDRRSALRLVMSLYDLRVLSRPGAAALVGPGRLCGLVATEIADAAAVLDAACTNSGPLACWAREGPPGLSLLEDRGFEHVEAAPRLTRMVRGAPEPCTPECLVTLLSVQAG